MNKNITNKIINNAKFKKNILKTLFNFQQLIGNLSKI